MPELKGKEYYELKVISSTLLRHLEIFIEKTDSEKQRKMAEALKYSIKYGSDFELKPDFYKKINEKK
uniref:Uncharacterized protein n=1 Tax=Methanococcus maripaludis (strain C6 / ATCC BAA-1332) TaxID=444158 RepID=A9A6U1_METM6